MPNAKLIFENTGETVELEEGSSVQEACENQGIPFGCTEGICGTCIVFVKKGQENLSAPTEAEIDFIGESGVKTERMMCQCCILRGEVIVKS